MISKYICELLEGNKAQNLISRRATLNEIRDHIDDSQSLLSVMDLNGLQVLDVGSGQGLPAIPLAISKPDSQFVLVESDLKKSQFLQGLVSKLELKNVSVIRSRIEDLGNSSAYRSRFDVVTSRAVAGLPTVLEWGLPFLKVGGMLVAWKGIRVEEELSDSEMALEILGGKVHQVKKYLIGDKERYLVLVRKERECPSQYPRKGGLAKKRPL
ncbi:MAG: 16S rRNA (guanine(527)-N(7))-methyltransferase RsmG [Bacillota bacterium]